MFAKTSLSRSNFYLRVIPENTVSPWNNVGEPTFNGTWLCYTLVNTVPASTYTVEKSNMGHSDEWFFFLLAWISIGITFVCTVCTCLRYAKRDGSSGYLPTEHCDQGDDDLHDDVGCDYDCVGGKRGSYRSKERDGGRCGVRSASWFFSAAIASCIVPILSYLAWTTDPCCGRQCVLKSGWGTNGAYVVLLGLHAVFVIAQVGAPAVGEWRRNDDVVADGCPARCTARFAYSTGYRIVILSLAFAFLLAVAIKANGRICHVRSWNAFTALVGLYAVVFALFFAMHSVVYGAAWFCAKAITDAKIGNMNGTGARVVHAYMSAHDQPTDDHVGCGDNGGDNDTTMTIGNTVPPSSNTNIASSLPPTNERMTNRERNGVLSNLANRGVAALSEHTQSKTAAYDETMRMFNDDSVSYPSMVQTPIGVATGQYRRDRPFDPEDQPDHSAGDLFIGPVVSAMRRPSPASMSLA